MIISSKSHYGLRAAVILAENYNEKPVSATLLEEEIKVSNKYLERIMRILTKEGFVRAKRGAVGGYYLNMPPETITVGAIVRALETEYELVDCVCENSLCVCPTKRVWSKLQKGVDEVLNSISLKQIIDGNY